MKIYDYNGKKNLCGEMLRKLRHEKMMTQEELCSQMQLHGVVVDRFAIAKIEAGTRFVADYELYVLAQIFEIKLEEFFEK